MYDLIVIGGGPGGYIAAERAGARKKSVLLIEKEFLGGTCLNVGCIPTKTLLHAAKLYRHALDAAGIGVHADGLRFDLAEAMKWKEEVVARLRSGVEASMKKYSVEVVAGEAELISPKTVRLKNDPARIFEGGNVIIATGSSPSYPPVPGAVPGSAIPGEGRVLDSTGMLSVDSVPASLAVIGGGAIGMEFACLFNALGTRVTVIEMLDEIIPPLDAQLAPVLRRALKGIDFKLGSRVEAINGTSVSYSAGGTTHAVEAEVILMATGRKPNTEGLGLEKLGIDATKTGIVTDDRMRTNVPGIYAIGDVTGLSLLAHSASRMGEVAVDSICGGSDRMRYDAIPWVVYTDPEASGCGLTEEEAKRRGLRCRSAMVPLRGNGRFLAENGVKAPGMCKAVVEEKSDVILGVQIIGGANSEMIFGVASFIENEMRAADVLQMVFPHPSVSESIKDALRELA